MDPFEALYREHSAAVYGFALYLSGDRDAAADLTSEAFVRAWGSPQPIRAATVRGYLFAIARNTYLQALRRERRRVAIDDELPDPSPGPAADFERSSVLGAALADLQKLPEGDRAALVLRVLADMPYDGIAATLGISLAATKVRIHRARLALIRMRERADATPGTAPPPSTPETP